MVHDKEVALNLPRFRISISWLMVAIAIAALNFAAIQASFEFEWHMGELLTLGAIPMANVLAVGMLIGVHRLRNLPFLLGFEAFGITGLPQYVYLAISSPTSHGAIDSYVRLLLDPMVKIIGHHPFGFFPIVCFVAVVMLGLPQLVFALIGGFLSSGYRITITRR
jgi:hypothetical protein